MKGMIKVPLKGLIALWIEVLKNHWIRKVLVGLKRILKIR